MSRIVVVGAGIAGLTAAYALSERHDVTVFESDARAGGKIVSQRIDGYVFDWGPTGFLSRASDLVALAADVGLGDEMIEADPAAAKRFVYWNGALRELPSKPPGMLTMDLLSTRGKLRVLGDLVARRPSAAASPTDESVLSFARRHFGREVAERIVAPALLGVSAGDAATTSLPAMFPRLAEAERACGSVIRGMKRGGAKPGRLTNFGSNGMQRFTDRLAERLGTRVRLNTRVVRVDRVFAAHGDGWRIEAGGDAIDVDAVVITAPAAAAAVLVRGFDEALADDVDAIAYAPMRVAGVAFRAEDLGRPLDGFGFLVARGQGVRILGALYTSAISPPQAPSGTAYVRVFLGGTTDPAAAQLSPADARAIVLADLATTIGVRAEPIAYHEVVWDHAIPQYDLGHTARLARIDARLARHRNLLLGGNAYRGLGVGDTVADAVAIAKRLG